MLRTFTFSVISQVHDQCYFHNRKINTKRRKEVSESILLSVLSFIRLRPFTLARSEPNLQWHRKGDLSSHRSVFLVGITSNNLFLNYLIASRTANFECIQDTSFWYFYRPQTKFAKVMISQVSVCPQGGGVSVQRGSVRETPHTVMSRWYTSYWNAFLFCQIWLQGNF